jgi:phage gpG-like protein
MANELEFSVNDSRVRDLFKRLAAPDKRRVLADVGNSQVANIKAGLMEGKAVPTGRIIPSLRVEAHGGQTLIDRGHMIGSVRVLATGDDSVTVGLAGETEKKKAVWHQYGTRTRRGRPWLPARPWFGFRQGDTNKLLDVLRDELKRRIGGGIGA